MHPVGRGEREILAAASSPKPSPAAGVGDGQTRRNARAPLGRRDRESQSVKNEGRTHAQTAATLPRQRRFPAPIAAGNAHTAAD